MSAKPMPRGIRNNNPGNIDRTTPRTPWQGLVPLEVAERQDPRFEVFSTPVAGLRALARTLVTYQDKHGLFTFRAIINRWAPPTENATDSYVTQVSRAVGVTPDTPIDVHDYDTMLPLAKAIVRHEQGDPKPYKRPPHWYDQETYDEALRRAGIVPRKPAPAATDPTNIGAAGGAVVAGVSAAKEFGLLDAVPLVKQYVDPSSPTGKIVGILALAAICYMIYRRWRKRRVEAQ